MRKPALLALAATLFTTACEPSDIAAPTPAATVTAARSTSIQHGDGTAESPYHWVEAGDWAPTYSFEETSALNEWDAAPCPPVYRGTLWMYIDIANVGKRKFWFQGPMHWVTTIAPGYARYRLVVPGVDERGEWTASGPVIAECRRGLLPGLGMIRLTDHEGQLRRNGINAGNGGGCVGGGDWYYMESYEPYDPAPAEDDAGVTADCGGGSGGAGFDPGNYSCSWDYITIEISYDGGKTWEHFWSGWAQVCEEHMA
jgi:hypothetical protein